MTDILDMEYINSLPQPFVTRLIGDDDFLYELHDVDVETGLCRINVCGLLQAMHIVDISEFRDMDGKIHVVDDFFSDAERG